MRPLFICCLAVAGIVSAQTGFRPLFDGKTLKGWDGDPRIWKIVNGEIVGNTEGVEMADNSFLIYRGKQFSNFDLKAKMKLRNHNSGIQFRSEELPNWVVRGYQADAAEGNWWGGVYEEKGPRGVMVNGWKGKAETVVKPHDWNDYEIRCNGDHIELFVNGLKTSELHDSARLKGIIALQVHKGPPMEVRFKDIEIKELP